MNFYKICLMLLILITIIVNQTQAFAYNKPISIDSRIKTFVYSQNEIFTIVFNYGYHSYIEFSKGETAKVIAMGNSTSWKVKPVDNKLFIMPLEKNGKTNMLIETNKGRSYAFDLICRSTNTRTLNASLNTDYSELRDLAYIVRFYYPKTEDEFDLHNVKASPISYTKSSNNINLISIIPNNTRYNYIYNKSLSKLNKAIVPYELFDDGLLTYFKFTNNNKTIPKIFTVNKYGQEIPCKMLLLHNYIIIKGVHKTLHLKDSKDALQIINKTL
ncbi:P-type conjugative transfer protein VirB9 [Neoehrlichia mikurensis]|uniref:P-type conjugative transfer protein VirB9 n=1 Tax=Neoehrlichia mikurensis TaxID=89586 RepID=A0A9Q9F4A3_9RICK|nr:P-type conjugative transfer protein VirB9 [Neoehrlichia mikurensis]QXK92310.1 P-type conjugative transfer protein VirB9 [Neoehrlichia mikurensis]QXK92764.1 P-type conjugative transfer protein VirB9 [Neoehrlichia mikurensis]QXK94005.1 P-type conjugative transfer protein VirB9 [Neoehrlichia mikurensis]UTO55832.1 P-type conjugative transfer protein VirB9 [Neoehrlichia mikurensis]UTO56747.1 P-type conjugative transfer protein VirB9 [Neoehrlichia mikurensis]